MNQRATAKSKPQLRIAFIQSAWHKDLVDQGRLGFIAEMKKLGIERRGLAFYEVPGAYEIPLHAKVLAKTGDYDAIVACGLVVDGGIYRHEFVASTVIDALMRVQLETEVPVFSAVLTPQQFHEHATHHAFFFRHLRIKGAEAAQACVRTFVSLSAIRSR